MSDDHVSPPPLEFTLDPKSASKRPEQLVTLLKRSLEQEFSEAFQVIEITHVPESSCVRITNLEELDDQTSKAVIHRARGVFNEFMTSPWY